jgi:hypothetical protein
MSTVVRHIFQACPVWIYTQSNITSIISTRLLQVVIKQLVPNLLTTWDKQSEHNLLTACWQTFYKM